MKRLFRWTIYEIDTYLNDVNDCMIQRFKEEPELEDKTLAKDYSEIFSSL